jgi:hypothetical protein
MKIRHRLVELTQVKLMLILIFGFPIQIVRDIVFKIVTSFNNSYYSRQNKSHSVVSLKMPMYYQRENFCIQ